MMQIHNQLQDATSSDNKKFLIFPEQVKYVCEELEDLKRENLELQSMVNLYASIIKLMGNQILFLSDEAEHLDRMLKISEVQNQRLVEELDG
jgi:hypothetical protein